MSCDYIEYLHHILVVKIALKLSKEYKQWDYKMPKAKAKPRPRD